jgi:hypothetical protein
LLRFHNKTIGGDSEVKMKKLLKNKVVQTVGYALGFALLVALMGYALVGGFTREKAPEMTVTEAQHIEEVQAQRAEYYAKKLKEEPRQLTAKQKAKEIAFDIEHDYVNKVDSFKALFD